MLLPKQHQGSLTHARPFLGVFLGLHVPSPLSRQGLKGMSAEKKSVADLVRHTKVPIQASLLRYSDSELNELATKNFQSKDLPGTQHCRGGSGVLGVGSHRHCGAQREWKRGEEGPS